MSIENATLTSSQTEVQEDETFNFEVTTEDQAFTAVGDAYIVSVDGTPVTPIRIVEGVNIYLGYASGAWVVEAPPGVTGDFQVEIQAYGNGWVSNKYALEVKVQ